MSGNKKSYQQMPGFIIIAQLLTDASKGTALNRLPQDKQIAQYCLHHASQRMNKNAKDNINLSRLRLRRRGQHKNSLTRSRIENLESKRIGKADS
jgi:hypothetical protein